MKIFTALLAAILLTGSSVATPTKSTLPPQIAVPETRVQGPTGYDGKLWDSALALYATAWGKTKFVCTTTPYERIPGGYHIISAGHCVQEIPAEAKFSVAEVIDGPRVPVDVIKARLDGSMDFSVFELKTARVYPILVFDANPIRIGDPVVNVNFAHGLTKQLSRGAVSSGELQDAGECLNFCGGDFMIQATGGPGASGSLVVSERTHRVIAIVVASGNGLGEIVEPISRFAVFLTLPPQAHPVEIEE